MVERFNHKIAILRIICSLWGCALIFSLVSGLYNNGKRQESSRFYGQLVPQTLLAVVTVKCGFWWYSNWLTHFLILYALPAAEKPSTIPRPTRRNPTSEAPIRIQRTPSYPDGSLDRVGYNSLDLVRTNDVLNPLDANSSLPISREASARVKAREAHKKVSLFFSHLRFFGSFSQTPFWPARHYRSFYLFFLFSQSSNPALYGDPPISSSKTKQSSLTTKKRTPSKTSQSVSSIVPPPKD